MSNSIREVGHFTVEKSKSGIFEGTLTEDQVYYIR